MKVSTLASCTAAASPLPLRSFLAGVLAVQMAMPWASPAQAQQIAQARQIAQTQQQAAEPPKQEAATQATATATPASAPGSDMRLTGDARILQALNRFTYGPRPGDLERVRAEGLNAWFQQQLKPEDIDDSALDERLKAYPAMSMPLAKMMELYPTNQMIRAAENGRASSPGGAAANAIYADQKARYDDRKNKKVGKPGDEDTRNGGDVSLPQAPAEIVSLAPDARFKLLCKLDNQQLRQLRRSLTPDQRDHLTDGLTPQQTEALAAFNSPSGVVAAEDVQVKLLRDIYSERQLNEVMVDFWLNHFNVYMKKSQQAPYYIAVYERDAVRPHALGHFENLLTAVAMSPAMLNYLDNASSIGPRSEYATSAGERGPNGRFRPQPQQKQSVGLNENYGRELMELHTLGVNGGYTQKDVTEVAKVFTGWTVDKQRGQDVPATATFDVQKHEPGDKLVLGQKIKYDGQFEGKQVIHLLATSPATARFISTKLAVRFVSDAPPAAMVDRMTAKFLDSNGDIRQVLLAMINSPEFFTVGSYRVKVKTPQEYVVSAVRAAGSDVRSASGLAEAVSDLGMPLYGMQTPNGYSMKSDAWNNTAALVSRMNFALALATNRVDGVSTNFNRLLGNGDAALTPEQKDTALEQAILHVPVSDRTQKLILQQTSGDTRQQASDLRQVATVAGKRDPLSVRSPMKRPADPSTLDTQAALASGLVFGSPEFQRR